MANLLVTNDITQCIVNPSINIALKYSEPVAGSFMLGDRQKTFLPTVSTINYPPPVVASVLGGQLAKTYKDDFYFKIRYLPPTLDVGVLTSNQERKISVFNGFFVNKTLDALNLSGNDGITITAPATPTVYNPLAIVEYTINLGTEGPSTIDLKMEFDWEIGIDDFTISVSGKRSIALPYLFQPETTEILAWKTQIITAEDGSEKRIRIRKAPRQELELNITVPTGQSNILDNILYAWRGNVFALPLSNHTKKSTALTATNSPLLSVNTDFSDFRVGGIGVIFESPTKFEIFQIVSFTQTEITANLNFTQVMAVGSLVMPAVSARLLSNPIRKFTGLNAQFSGTFLSLDNQQLTTSASPVQYKGLDVYTDEVFLQNRSSDETYIRNTISLDYETGIQDVFNNWKNTKPSRGVLVKMDTLEEAWNFRLWLHRRSGQLRPFWMPTHENNFKILSTGVIGGTFLIKDEGQLTLLGNRLGVAVNTKSGWILADIIPPLVQTGNDLTITLDTAINLPREDIISMSYLDKKRLASDKVNLTWGANLTSTCSFKVVNVD